MCSPAYAFFLMPFIPSRSLGELEQSIPLSFLTEEYPDPVSNAASIQKIHQKQEWFQIILHEHMEIDAERKLSAVIEKYVLAWARQHSGTYPAELFAKLYAASCLATICWSLEHDIWQEDEVADLISRYTRNGFFKEYLRIHDLLSIRINA